MSNRDSIRARVFYLIRSRDVELAEDYLRRCPDVKSIQTLNGFFHRTLSQCAFDTQDLRGFLDDTVDLETWCQTFDQQILPTLRRFRFPPFTDKRASPFYETVTRQVVYG